MKKLLLIAFLVPHIFLFSQSNELAGDWKAYLPYNVGIDIAQNESHIFYATPYSLFSIHKESNEIQTMSKIDGLTDVSIQNITYDAYNQQLFISYTNSNIDIIKADGTVINVPDIKNNSTIIGNKLIHDLYIYDENLGFLATNFGIVEFRLKSLEFGSTIFTPNSVNMIRAQKDTLYAATDNGMYTIINSKGINISDFGQWDKHTSSPTLGAEYKVEHIAIYNDSIYITSAGKLYTASLDKPVFERALYTQLEGHRVAFFSQEQENLIIGLIQDAPFSKIMVIKKDGTVIEGGADCINRLRYALEDTNGKVWYADDYREIRSSLDYTSGCDKMKINGPLTAECSDVEVVDGVLYVATGGASETYTIQSIRSGFFQLKDGSWTNYYDQTLPAIRNHDFANIYKVAKRPGNPWIYLASYYNGLLAYNTENGETNYYDAENSKIEHPVGEADGERLSGITYDAHGNLWMTSIYANRPLTVFTKEGQWYNYTIPGSKALAQCEVDQAGLIWSIIVGSSGGLLVYDTGGTLETDGDDQSKVLGTGNSALTSGVTNCIKRDLNGDMWVGTDKGPVIFRSGTSVFQDISQGRRLKVVQNGIVDFLLATQDVRAIEVDGANRKWIGTRNGIFVMSAGGDEEVAYFNTENSPLLDNTIRDMSYDGATGVMYIATSKGIVSYKTETSTGTKTHNASAIYAYPNPVQANYQGNIYIKGLARDAQIKITDIEGKLVHETTALGGTAVWNGKDYNNRRAAPGVYLVFSTVKTGDGSNNYVTKIMLVE